MNAPRHVNAAPPQKNRSVHDKNVKNAPGCFLFSHGFVIAPLPVRTPRGVFFAHVLLPPGGWRSRQGWLCSKIMLYVRLLMLLEAMLV